MVFFFHEACEKCIEASSENTIENFGKGQELSSAAFCFMKLGLFFFFFCSSEWFQHCLNWCVSFR